MANHPSDGTSDDFFEQILRFPPYAGADSNLAGNESSSSPVMLQLNLEGSSLSLEQGKIGGGFMYAGSGERICYDVSVKSGLRAQPMMHNPFPAMPHSPAIRPRVRARRGQATDPHSIAERLRRKRIAERIRALQELVPSVNKVLSMSRLGGAGALAPLVIDVPFSLIEEEGGEDRRNQPIWERWSNDGIEQQVTKLVEENVGAAMQLLQSKALYIMPISLASAICHTQPPYTTTLVNHESDYPSC